MLAEADLAQLLDDARRRHGVVGAALGVGRGGQLKTAASGLLNLQTGVEATPDAVFQIGSIGKLFTAALIMQLVEEGRLALEQAVVELLPDFAVADPAASRRITVRQLLTHSSGLAGDFFPEDDPQGPSAASYLRKMRLLPQLFAPGAGFSYCNSGYVVAGRLVEVLRGQCWSQVVQQRICAPLGLRRVVAEPHQSLRFRCAIGHLRDPDDAARQQPAPHPYLSRSMAAAGTVLSLSAGELLRFAGALVQGHPGLISADTARQMRQTQYELPPRSHAEFSHWGLGWGLNPASGTCGHDGETLGQQAYLRCDPAADVRFVLLSNSPSRALYEELAERLLPQARRLPAPGAARPGAWTPERYAGSYRQLDAVFCITAGEGELLLRFEDGDATFQATLVPLAPDVFEIRAGHPDFTGTIAFSIPQGQARADTLRKGLRLYRRSFEPRPA